MSEENIRSILRVIAVVTILVGAILTTMALINLGAASSAVSGAGPGLQVRANDMVTQLGLYSVLAQLPIAVWGVALWVWSPSLARRIVA